MYLGKKVVHCMYVSSVCYPLHLRVPIIHIQFAQLLKKMMIEYYVKGEEPDNCLFFVQTGFTKLVYDQEKKKRAKETLDESCSSNNDIVKCKLDDENNKFKPRNETGQYSHKNCKDNNLNNSKLKCVGQKRPFLQPELLHSNCLKKRKFTA